MSEPTVRRAGMAASPWVLPPVQGPVVGRPDAGQSAASLEAEYQQARRNGFEDGRREGLTAGASHIEARQRELDARITAVEALLEAMSRPLERLDEAATAELARSVEIPVIASGGLASIDDIKALIQPEYAMLEGAISGRALYDGRIDPKEALRILRGA